MMVIEMVRKIVMVMAGHRQMRRRIPGGPRTSQGVWALQASKISLCKATLQGCLAHKKAPPLARRRQDTSEGHRQTRRRIGGDPRASPIESASPLSSPVSKRPPVLVNTYEREIGFSREVMFPS